MKLFYVVKRTKQNIFIKNSHRQATKKLISRLREKITMHVESVHKPFSAPHTPT